MVKKYLLILLLYSSYLTAQPHPPGPPPGKGPPCDPSNPACLSPNPPPFCDCNTVPIDTYEYVLWGIGLFLGIYYIYREEKKIFKLN